MTIELQDLHLYVEVHVCVEVLMCAHHRNNSVLRRIRVCVDTKHISGLLTITCYELTRQASPTKGMFHHHRRHTTERSTAYHSTHNYTVDANQTNHLCIYVQESLIHQRGGRGGGGMPLYWQSFINASTHE